MIRFQPGFPLRRRALILAAGLSLWSAAGCRHSPVVAQKEDPVPIVPCMHVKDLVAKTSTAECSTAQKLCMLERDLEAAVRDPSFVPNSGYQATWRPRVAVWQGFLAELSKHEDRGVKRKAAVLEVAVTDQVQSKEQGEELRGLLVADKTLLCHMQKLHDAAKSALPSSELLCEWDRIDCP